MLRITALNDRNRNSQGGLKPCVQIRATKEALESEAIALYNKALNLRNLGETKQAIQSLVDVLNSPFLQEATSSNVEDGISHSAELLKYSANKNLAEMSEKENNLVVAMEHYIEAIAVDSTDVTVWFKMGRLALQLENFSLARHSFEMGLQCNASHWPCLDRVISLLYAFNNYEACLHYIARALTLDPSFAKGIVLMRKIFSEHPGLRAWSHDIFTKCDQSIYTADVDDDEAAEFLREVAAISNRKRELCKSADIPSVSFTHPMTSYSWKNLGECLLSLYKDVSQTIKDQPDTYDGSQPRLSLASRVDFSTSVCVPASCDDGSTPSSPPPPSVQSQATDEVVVSSAPETASSIPTTPTRDPFLLPDLGSAMDLDQTPNSGGRKRGRKRKAVFIEEPEYKRRSTRVKNPVKTNVEEPVSFEKILYKFLPKALLSSTTDSQRPTDRQCDVGFSGGDDASVRDPSDCMLRSLKNEVDDVQKFIQDYQENNGVINLITKYLLLLSDQPYVVWPSGLTDVFMMLYRKVRKHINYPNYFTSDSSDELICKMAKMSLLHKELKLDRWSSNHINIVQSLPKKSLVVGSNVLGKYFESDVEYLMGLTAFSDKLGDFWLEFCIRVYWLQAKYFLLQNNLEMAIGYFEKTTEYVQMLCGAQTLCLSNCRTDRIISLRELERQLDSLQRCQSMEELRKLVDDGQHQKVIEVLLPADVVTTNLDVERMNLLRDAIIAGKEFHRGLVWAEEYFHETLLRFKGTTSESQKDICKDILFHLLGILNQFLQCDPSVLSTFPGHSALRFAHDLIDVINLSTDVPEGTATEMMFESVAPWILLYRVIKHYEDTDSSAADEDSLPSSIGFLVHSHEHLGRHGWCTCCDGELLLFVVEVLTTELATYAGEEDSHPFEEDLDNALQQCFSCLYGHRSKKAKYLEEHSATQILLTLDRCQTIFDYFKPKQLPEYDSYKMNAISAELEALLRRIFPLIPPVNPGAEADITSYLDGLVNTPPSPADKEMPFPLVKELYYLLADYYFKNKEQSKAIKFYTYDICVNPTRFDSWAGMALTRSSRLENKITSEYLDDHNCDEEHDMKQEASLQKLAFATLRCFKRAMELDDSNVKLWIEYGACAYQLHSHASRLLKQSKFAPPLSKELIEQTTTNKVEMLTVALDCYTQAQACALESGSTEDDWLIHYMLGKIAEKQNRDPAIFLDHYKKAFNCLHEDKAKYPKKISYFSPPHLAVEVLEMYYRTHVSIVKFLMKFEDNLDKVPFDVFEFRVQEAANGPLANFAEKKHDRKSEVDNKDAAGAKSGGRVSCNDHNYSKPKTSAQPGTSATADSVDAASTADVSVNQDVLSPTLSSLRKSSVVLLEPYQRETEVRASDETVAGGDPQPMDLTAPTPMSSPVKQEAMSANTVSSVSASVIHVEKADIVCKLENKQSVVTSEVPPKMSAASPGVVLVKDESGVNSGKSVDERKNDSDDLDALISTLAAVQKSIENETQAETKKELTTPSVSEPVAMETEAVATGTEERVAEVSPMETNVGMEVTETKQSDVKPTQDKSVEKDSTGSISADKKPDVAETADTEKRSPKRRFQLLMNDCMKALNLCQTRFPEHFRSVYRLAHVYFFSPSFKNVRFCKELLLGGNSIHFGLFHERKQNNFFNGLWRNPVQDLDRWGSFSAHLNRALLLLFDVLVVLKDSRMLYNMHQHLCRAPIDIAKKYLRDTDRVQLARMAFELCCKTVEAQIRDCEKSGKLDQQLLLHICEVRNQSHKLSVNVEMMDQALVEAYRLCGMTLDAIQNPYLLMQLPKLSQFANIDRDARQQMPMQVMSPVTATSKCISRPTIPLSPVISSQTTKPFPVSPFPIQKPAFQSNESPKQISCTVTTDDDVEIIDLSSDDCSPTTSTSTKPLAEEKESAGGVTLEEANRSKGCAVERKDDRHVTAFAKDLSLAGSSFKGDAPKSLAPTHSKPSPSSSKFVSAVGSFPKGGHAAGIPVSLRRDCGDSFARASTSSKLPRSSELLKFFSQPPLLQNSTPQNLASVGGVPSTKVSLSQALLSNIGLLNILPKETRDLLVFPWNKVEPKEIFLGGNQPSASSSKAHTPSQTSSSKIPTVSSPPSDPSSSSCSAEIIELSSSGESD